ncbi:MAG: RNA methyltransferase [Candidatus Omnitrophica bacterium]|nr:RNA methyltransferase [Candidatus Omnitrophota bacterium]
MELFGKNAVQERLRVNPASVRKIICAASARPAPIEATARQRQVTCVYLADELFQQRARGRHTQGIIAEIADFVYTDAQEILAAPAAQKRAIVALSGITDPQNFGSIIRTLACYGDFAVVIPQHRSVPVNETVLKVACGGENYVPVCQVKNLIPFLQAAKKAGYWIVGTVPASGENICSFSFPWPLCVVIGSEGEGIRRGVAQTLDARIFIPMAGGALSLNAAVACAVVGYEAVRQRSQRKN